MAAKKDKESLKLYFQYLYVSPIVRIPSFVFGLIAAWLWVNQRERLHALAQKKRGALISLTAFLVVVLWLVFSQNPYVPYPSQQGLEWFLYQFNAIFSRALVSLIVAYMILYSLICKDSYLSSVLKWRIFKPIAQYSYSMYLFHPVIVFAVLDLVYSENKISSFPPLSMITIALLSIALSFIIGFMTYFFIERHFLRRKQ